MKSTLVILTCFLQLCLLVKMITECYTNVNPYTTGQFKARSKSRCTELKVTFLHFSGFFLKYFLLETKMRIFLKCLSRSIHSFCRPLTVSSKPYLLICEPQTDCEDSTVYMYQCMACRLGSQLKNPQQTFNINYLFPES